MDQEKKSSNINLEAIRHSGDLEGNLQEDHYDKENASSVQEFKGLDTDQIRQVAPAPETSGVLILTPGERPAFKEKYTNLVESHETQAPEHATSHTGRNIGIAATVLALAAGAATVAANNQAPNTGTETNPSATSTPVAGETQAPIETKPASPLASPTNLGPLETEKPTPSASPEVKTMYTVEQLKAMTPAEYNTLPRNERLVLVQDMLKDAKKVTAYYGDVYDFNPLDVASKENSAQEIMNQIKYTIQLPLFQKESPAADDMRINKTNAQKAMSAAFYDVSGEVTPLFTDIENKIQKTNTVLEVTDKYSNVKEVGPPQVTVDKQGKEIQYRTITFLSGEVNTHTAKVVFTQTSNGKGIWQLYDFNDKA